MKVLIAGATGHTGQRVVRQLQDEGHSPVALVRESSDTSVLPDDCETRQGDLADLPQDACKGMDAVIFAAGSGSSTGPDMTDTIDRDGAIALVDAAQAAGVNKFVMLSSIGADDPDPDSDLHHYLKAKHDADVHLVESELAYSIIRPVSLTQEDGHRRIRLGEEVEKSGKAHRGDVAAVLVRALEDPALENRAFDMDSVPEE
ncbi:SDR family oxidoreductase [Qipengyuania sp. JC766]|uniref:SDR family oxidoreductase n=1 Tax=Qipengyuania sp. JC766 TaxID=3232139 RepID=UPI00345A9A8C